MSECETLRLLTGFDHAYIASLGGVAGCCEGWMCEPHDHWDDTPIILKAADEHGMQ